MASIDVNSSSLRKWSANLDKLGRSDLPIAIRSSLNAAAFDMKKTSLPASAKDNFKHLKKPNFFKRFTGVEKANGFNINQMRATFGMTDMGQATARSAVENMKIQEQGGNINEGLDYLKDSRGGNVNGTVRRANYYNKSRVISARARAGKNTNKKSQFIAKADQSLNQNKPMFIETSKGNYLMQVLAIKKTKAGRITIKSKLILKERENVKIKATHFIKEAAAVTQKKIPDFYIEEAKKRIEKTMRQ